MKSQLRNASLAASLFFIAFAVETYAQYLVPRTVVGSGAVQTANANNRIAGTVGQPIIGVGKASSNNAFLGFWYNKDNVVVHVERLPGHTPSGFTLNEIYPNPISFSSEASIGFTIPSNAQIKLSIVDNLGSLVAMLLDETLDGGTYSMRFTPQPLPSGLYYTVLQSGVLQVTKRLLIVR